LFGEYSSLEIPINDIVKELPLRGYETDCIEVLEKMNDYRK
jgi:hypothetical protein